MHSKDWGYMKLLQLYRSAIQVYIANGPVVPASEAAGETAVAVCSQTAVAVCSDDPTSLLLVSECEARYHSKLEPETTHRREEASISLVCSWWILHMVLNSTALGQCQDHVPLPETGV